MSQINHQQIEQLIELIGGKTNIASVTHCLTRLRFVLTDPTQANVKQIEAIPCVKGCFTNAGQFQVVIGTDVDQAFALLQKLTGSQGVSKEEAKVAARQNMSPRNNIIYICLRKSRQILIGIIRKLGKKLRKS